MRPGKLIAVLPGGGLVGELVSSMNDLQAFHEEHQLVLVGTTFGGFEVRNAGAPCGCHRCLDEDREIRTASNPEDGLLLTLGFVGMVVCAQCGNKRCPHATDHRLECSRSNLPGQPGSAYAGQNPL